MSVTTSQSRIGYTGDGTTVNFAFPYLFQNNADIEVWVNNVQVTSGFTTTGASNASLPTVGGNVAFTTAPQAGASIVLFRNPSTLQNTVLAPNDPFPAKTVETMVDAAMLAIQRLNDILALEPGQNQLPVALSYPFFESNLSGTLPPAAVRANSVLAFDQNGLPTTASIPPAVGAGNMTAEIGLNGHPGFKAGTDFTVGAASILTLSQSYGSVANVLAAFDGVYQEKDSYIIVGNQIKFGAWVSGTFVVGTFPAISNIDVTGGTTLSIFAPAAGTVGAAQFQPGAITNVAVAANAGIDSSKIAYQRAAVGAAMRLLFDKLGERFDARDFTGIVGDGVTDCTAGINAALAAMGPGVLIFPAGTFNTTGNHTLSQGQYIAGAGKNATQIFNTGLTSDTFKAPFSFSGVKDITLTGTASRTAGTAINANGAPSHTYISRVSIFNFADAGVKLNGVVQYIDELDISIPTTITGSGILITGGGDQYIRGITFDGRVAGTGPTQCFAGINISNNGGVWCSDSDFIHAQIGVIIAATNVVTQFMFFHNVAADTCSNNGWLISTSGTGTINDCAFSQCWGASATNNGLQVTGVPGSINGLAFSNFRAIGNGTDGIFLQNGCVNVNFVGGLVSGNSLSPTLTTSGIHIGAGLTDIIINGMRVGPSGSTPDTQLTQILVDAGAGDRISIVGCNLKTANTPINMQASGLNNTISGCTGVTLKGRVAATTDAGGHVTVTHNNGSVMGTVQVTVDNGGAMLVGQWTGVSNTVNFQLIFFGSGGAVAANTALSFSWLADF